MVVPGLTINESIGERVQTIIKNGRELLDQSQGDANGVDDSGAILI
jgi:hypothetical protein